MKYHFNGYSVDTHTVELTNGGTAVAVEPLVFKLLVYLIRHRDKSVSRDELLEALWPGKVVSDATISNAVKLARQAVGDNGTSQAVIRTVRGHGFRFVARVEETNPRGPVEASSNVDPELVDRVVPDRPSLALLPFQDLSGDESDVLARGLTVDLHSRLARLSGLFVIALESASQFSIRQNSVTSIGRRLGVRYIAHGSTQKSGDRIRVTINLIETESQQVVWSEHYDRIFDDLFLVQDEMVNTMVSTILPELERAEMERSRLLPTENLDAWACYHRAMWHNFRFTTLDSGEARALLVKAMEIDPRFSRAYAGLSFNHFLHAFLNTDSEPEEHVRLSLEYAQQSVSLDSRDAMAHWVMGRALFLSREHDQALLSLDRALLANPNYAQGRYARGFVKNYAGKADSAIADLDTSRRLSPFDPLMFAMKSSRAVSLALRGDTESAWRWAVEATQEVNAHFHIHAVAAACLEMAGKPEQARNAAARTLQLYPQYSLSVYDRSFPHLLAEDRARFHTALIGSGIPEH